MSGQLLGSVDTANFGALHDVQLDYYGKRLAAASENHTIRIYDISNDQQICVGELKGHEGPVWCVSWAHPKFGSILASCSYDMKVIVWKEAQPGQWQIAFQDASHAASVNAVQFCPWEFGLRLACASSDGTVSVLTHQADQQWRRASFNAHGGGAQTLSWSPGGANSMRLVTGGFDCSVNVYKCEGEVWSEEGLKLPVAHSDCIRAVSWRPDAFGTSVIASGSWDKTVIIWSQELEGQCWRQVCKLPLQDKVEGLSWSVTGSILAVSCSESETALYKEAYDGRYEEVGRVNEPGFTEVQSSMTARMNLSSPKSENGPILSAAAAQDPQVQAQQQNVMDAFGLT